MGSERSASESSWEAGYLLTDNEPDRTENAPLGPSVSASAANSVRQAPRPAFLTVAMPTFAFGHFFHHDFIVALSVEASLTPCSVLGCLPGLGHFSLPQEHLPFFTL